VPSPERGDVASKANIQIFLDVGCAVFGGHHFAGQPVCQFSGSG